MTSISPAPKEPSLHTKALAAVGPNPFLVLGALQGAGAYYGYHELIESALKKERTHPVISNPWRRQILPGAERFSRSPTARVLLIATNTLFPWVIPAAWYARRCQTETEEWKRWKLHTGALLERFSDPSPSATTSTTSTTGAEDSSLLPQAPPTVSTRGEGGYRKFERVVARCGFYLGPPSPQHSR